MQASRPLLRAGIVLSGVMLSAPLVATGCTVTNGIVIGVRDELFGHSKRVDYDHEVEFGVQDPQFRRTLDSISAAMVDDNSATILVNGDEMFPAMLGDIRAAATSVNLETFLFEDDEVGRMFADAMIEAAGRGVQVRLLVDDWGENLGDLEDEMSDAGVRIEKYRPIKLYTLYRPGIRTHRKLLIVDGRIGYTGGLGIDERWLGDARNPDEWRETQVRVTGPVVAQLQSIFAENWVFASSEILIGDAFYPEPEQTGTVLAHAIRSSSGDSASIPKLLYHLLIHSSQHYIHIHNAYFIPDEETREALIHAVGRGVNVEVIVPGKHNDLPILRQTSRSHYGELLEGGVKIYEYEPTMMHAKTVVVDGIFSTIGTINFDARSMRINAENSLSFYDREVAERMEALFQTDKKKCHEVTLESWRNRGLYKRVAELISWIWEPYY